MIPKTRGWRNVLQLGLIVSAIGWGISFLFTFAPWTRAADQLQAMGADPLAYDPIMDYWLRMASSVFGCIGIASAIACIRPEAFLGLIRLLGPFHLIVGSTLTVAAIRNGLETSRHPTFVADITFCFLAGTLILLPLVCGWRDHHRKTV